MTALSSRTKRYLRRTGVVFLLLFVAIQFVPYGREHSNPPVLDEPEWSDEATRHTFLTACGDCHSNETRWPWYSHVAPASWLVTYDVGEGRSHLNVSEWGRGEQEADEAVKMIREGEMPPWYYVPAHPDARLSRTEKETFIRGLTATFGTEETVDGHTEDEESTGD